ncbi:MAG: hypothetical protein ACFB0C_05135 [Leptolyngbyaceae cyanobacterium]
MTTVVSVGWQQPSSITPWRFSGIPPERQGLRGEYDYHGLAKRVWRCYQENFRKADLAQLTIRQRGRVISLQGWIPSEQHLQQLAQLALALAGTARVETHRVVVLMPAAVSVAASVQGAV